MQDEWVQQQWSDLCRRMHRSAEHWGKRAKGNSEKFLSEATEFVQKPEPERYPELLERVRDAARIAVGWSEQTESASVITNKTLDKVEEADVEPFPASETRARNVANV